MRFLTIFSCTVQTISIQQKTSTKVIQKEKVEAKREAIPPVYTLDLIPSSHSSFGDSFSLFYELHVTLKDKAKYSLDIPFIFYPGVPTIEKRISGSINSLYGADLGDFYDNIFVSEFVDERRMSFSTLPQIVYPEPQEYDDSSSSSGSYSLEDEELNNFTSSVTPESLGRWKNVLVFSFSDPQDEARLFIEQASKIISGKGKSFSKGNDYDIHPVKAKSQTPQAELFPDTINFIDTSSFLIEFLQEKSSFELKTLLLGLPDHTNLSAPRKSSQHRSKHKAHGLIICCAGSQFWTVNDKSEESDSDKTKDSKKEHKSKKNKGKSSKNKVGILPNKENIQKLEKFYKLCRRFGIPPFIVFSNAHKKVSKREFRQFLHHLTNDISSDHIFYKCDEEILQKVTRKFKLQDVK